MVVRAPVAGRVLTRTVRPGDVASPSTVMFTLARDDRSELDAEIPEELLGAVHPGDHARVRLASGRWVEGTVRLVAAQVDAQTRLGRARILPGGSRDPSRRLCPRRNGRKACAGVGRAGGGGLL
jgi:HlyD family secretion protein